ncbi:GFA family protein [Phaeovibrio sulfidiphilus]|uniref:GFA family protein n=1 Tax=Phaeovibrio sulfidiphilus TaxID=1220600 RepID=A0A8J6YL68_9PROT|nr:GFA family protein [Phaeovibrio sulfidiphilus]MBE1236380.1 GFA family protein [Phaeovibrio sulfidiphilus]
MTDCVQCSGRCLCGAVSFTAGAVRPRVAACHCTVCRTWSGGPFLALDAGPDVTFDGTGSVAVYPSSEHGERGFCRVCGTHLFYRTTESPAGYILPAGLVDRGQDFVFTTQLFIDRKPGYYDFANETRRLTEAEVFAVYES